MQQGVQCKQFQTKTVCTKRTKTKKNKIFKLTTETYSM